MEKSEKFPFIGEFRERYTGVATDLQQRIVKKKDGQDYTLLGEISENPREYFNSTPVSQECARIFLTALFNGPDIIQRVKDAYQKRREFFGKKHQKLMSPMCLTFATMHIRQKNLCFMMFSGNNENDTHDNNPMYSIMQEIEDMAKQSNPQQYSSHCIDFIPLKITLNFHNLIGFSSQQLSRQTKKIPNAEFKKPCTEKKLASLFTKLLDTYGSDITITGISNYSFYPFFDKRNQDGIRFYIDNDGEEPHDGENPCLKILITGNPEEEQFIFIPKIPSCHPCTDNKISIFEIMCSAKRHAQEEPKTPPRGTDEEDPISGSPLTQRITQTINNLLGLSKQVSPPDTTSAPLFRR